MHHAFTSSELITLTSQFHFGASARNAAVLGIRRLATPRTLSTWAESRLSWFFLPASETTWPYACAALRSIWKDETSVDMDWRRSTPTTPPSVVCTVWQAARATAATRQNHTENFICAPREVFSTPRWRDQAPPHPPRIMPALTNPRPAIPTSAAFPEA